MNAKLKYTMMTCLALAITACGGGGDGPSSSVLPVIEPIGDVSGSWTVTDTITSATGVCASEVGANKTTYPDITQSGNDITSTFINQSGTTSVFTGTVSGDEVTLSGSEPDDGGTATSNSKLIISADCNSFSGDANWTWSDGVESCSGVSRITGNRDIPVGCGG